MQKIEYGDINKFLVSIGLVLLALAILSPYLYLTQDFGLYIEQEKFDKLREPVQKLILDKQNKIETLQFLFYWIPGILAASGIICLSVGLSRWKKRQFKIDEKFDKEIDKLTIEIRSLSQEERVEKVKEEIREIENKEDLKPKEVSNLVFEKYIAVEEAVTDVFNNYNSKNFEVFSQQKFGNKFQIDIYLKAKSSKFTDRIVEIKYFKSKISSTVITSILEQFNSNLKYYKSLTHKPVVPVLIIVYHLDQVGRLGLMETETRILSQRMNFSNLRRLKTEFIEENQIDKFQIQKILKK